MTPKITDLVAVFLVIAAGTGVANAAEPPAPPLLYGDAVPVRTLYSLNQVAIPNTTIDSVVIDAQDGYGLVTAIVNHPPASDHVKVWIALPVKGWNGRFLGTGGGGYLGGYFSNLRSPAERGYAVGVTDTGHEGGDPNFALDSKGQADWQSIRDNSYLGIHDMTVVGRALATAFYGREPRMYFQGGSTGGRQALMEAQRFPNDYDGIVAFCPAINRTRYVPAELWSQIVMRDAGDFMPKAKFDAVTAAAVAACDAADGVVDGVIDDPMHCTYDPRKLIGAKVEDSTFTATDAEVVRQIWEGPRGHDGRFLWYGLKPGGDLAHNAATAGSPLVGAPSGEVIAWFRYFVLRDPNWDWMKVSRDEYELLWNQSVEQFGTVVGTDDPDLKAFRDHGGKLIMLHGLADQIIPPEGSIDYYLRVENQMGGPAKTSEFARLFLVPGVDHGFKGAGSSPKGVLEADISWVEEGKAPDRIEAELRDPAGKLVRSRPLFPYPKVVRYKGTGSTDDAANFIAADPRQ